MEWLSAGWEHGEYEAVRALRHKGSWAFVTNKSRRFSDPDELVEAIRHAQLETSYKLFTFSHEQLGDALLATAYVRTPANGGRDHNLGHHFFLVGVRDGLYYSSEHVATEVQARAAFRGRAPV